ncbi:Uncharacterised protein [Moraxella lacunata]|uniref:Uncharacterized protein n=1 Tax=Moraxella lacunata TaxID=477 RepID=A0A378UC22_MORLA|nr:Uncharacterised protein [Moraxella lacunata]
MDKEKNIKIIVKTKSESEAAARQKDFLLSFLLIFDLNVFSLICQISLLVRKTPFYSTCHCYYACHRYLLRSFYNL